MKLFSITTLSLFVTLISFNSFASQITGDYPSLKNGDKVTLHTDKYGYPNFTGFAKEYSTIIRNHKFKLIIPAGEIPLLCSLNFNDANQDLKNFNLYRAKSIRVFYIEKSDNVRISETNIGITYSGKGAFKYQIFQNLLSNERQLTPPLINFSQQPVEFIKAKKAIAEANLIYLEKNRSSLNLQIYDLIKSFIVGEYLNATEQLNFVPDSARLIILQSIQKLKLGYPAIQKSESELNKSSDAAYSDAYTDGILSKYKLDSCFQKQVEFSLSSYCDYIKRNYFGILRERLITNILFLFKAKAASSLELLNDALTWVTTEDYKNILLGLKAHRMEGAQAYNFSLKDDMGKIHSMSEYKGKIVFLDFWFTGCGNCIMVKPYIEKIESVFKNEPVVFLSINVDQKKADWLKSISSGKYTTSSSINLNVGDLGFNSPTSNYYSVDGGPTLIIIDKNGRIMAPPVDPRIDNGKNIIALISKSLQ
jgi:thiol-disulfide isomerase/thioredoxin